MPNPTITLVDGPADFTREQAITALRTTNQTAKVPEGATHYLPNPKGGPQMYYRLGTHKFPDGETKATLSYPRFIVEYLRKTDLDSGDPRVYVRHSSAETAELAEEQTLATDPRDIILLSASTVEEYRAFPGAILGDPECSVEHLLGDKTHDD